ncbi:MAG: hypothetical protein CVU55_02535 [Deltaproteobacteria bacterium HGW-Deltaproteobacteria-13]|jgi:hypothetical protein|nr:MAG: hypothetical protein CVU55_02535 [Deltaproteobacteria bacterium HGW-Deltaproteobacteria-13]
MGFFETYSYILSYFGIGFLGLGILLSIALIIPACYWLFTSLSVNQGSVAFRRIILMFVVTYISFAYLRSPSFYEIMGWWKTTFLITFIIGFIVPVLRMDIARPDRKKDRGIAFISGAWWSLLIFSEALLVSGASYQVVVLYLFTGISGILCGGMMGTTFAQTARRKISESVPATGAQ